jgi:3',5'-cyclic AMP phosphodiesterase CpdA
LELLDQIEMKAKSVTDRTYGWKVLWENYNNNDDNRKKKIKIIAMHHHLIGIPDTGTGKIIIVDAGDTLRACLQSSVDLVICGHKHRPWLWNLGALQIAYAGTTSSE